MLVWKSLIRAMRAADDSDPNPIRDTDLSPQLEARSRLVRDMANVRALARLKGINPDGYLMAVLASIEDKHEQPSKLAGGRLDKRPPASQPAQKSSKRPGGATHTNPLPGTAVRSPTEFLDGKNNL